MTDEIPDRISALVVYLREQTPLTELVGNRVYGTELPRPEISGKLGPRGNVIVREAGGAGQIGKGFQNYGDSRIDVLCYGATPAQARQVSRRVHPILDDLHRITREDCLIHWCRQITAPLSLRDPDIDWPYSFSSWQVLAAEIPVP